MLSNHLKITIRRIARNKTFSWVNLLGLTTGITACLFVAQFVWFEYSFERFNGNADQTYRINLYNTSNGLFDGISSGTVSGLAYSMDQTIPGIEFIGRISSMNRGMVANNERQIEDVENEIVFADPSIIELLGINLIEGTRTDILKEPQSAIISKSIALKYFGDTQVTGKFLNIGFNGSAEEPKSFQIKGVFNDIPSNSHRHFDFVLGIPNEQRWNENWAWSNVSTYVRLQAGLHPEDVSHGLADIVKQHHQDNTGDLYLLEPINEIRLHALDGSGRATLVNFFVVLGGVVLLLAWCNYVSLSTSRFLERMKEVGIRKLVGASRKHLIAELLTEAFFLNVISFACALLVYFVTWPWLASYLHIQATADFLDDPMAYGVIVIAVIAGTLFSGFYPSLFLSSFKPLQSIRGKLNNLTDRSSLRKVLVVIQLSISVVLIAAIFAIRSQLDFMRDQNKGIALEQILIVEEPIVQHATAAQEFEPFRNAVIQIPAVRGITHASSFPGSEIDWHRTDITVGEENVGHRFDSRIIAIGYDFLDVFGLSLIAGRNFYSDSELDQRSMLINEEACRMFGFESYDQALNKLIFIGSKKCEIVGVVKNYHFRSFQHQMQPLLYLKGSGRNSNYAIKISESNVPATIAKIESVWKEAHQGNVFRYYFLDDKFDSQYAGDQRVGEIIAGLTLLAIFISCLGLFALSLYSVSQRVKEIGIRKILGASRLNVMVLLSQDFFKLLVLAAIIGVPLIFAGLTLWLERFAYRMPIGTSLFLWPIAIVALLTLMTISFQTINAAKANPAESIKAD
jgi:putative ABC transport system permease protein